MPQPVRKEGARATPAAPTLLRGRGGDPPSESLGDPAVWRKVVAGVGSRLSWGVDDFHLDALRRRFSVEAAGELAFAGLAARSFAFLSLD